MKKFPKYSSYKESEIEWLQEIPEHWDEIKIKHLFKERVEKGFEGKPLLAATQSGGVIKKEDYATNTVTAQKDFHLLKLVKIGDFVISLRSFQGGIEISYEEGIISPAYTIMKPKSSLDKNYFKHLFKSKYFIDGLATFVTGIREGQNIDYSKFRRSNILLPPPSEQTAIANFLDKKTTEIKEFIALKEKTIELLKERKMAIINELVTGKKVWNGTEWAAPKEVKDSGIEWLDKIPKDWEVKKLKYVSKIIYGISPHESTYNIEGKGKILINGPAEYSVENFGYTRAIKWTTLPVKFARKGDLLFCLRGSTTGRLNICHDDVAIGRGCAALRGEIDQDFFILAIFSLKEKIIETFKGSTFPSVTSEDLNNYSITFCSETEMKKIVKKANEINLEIDDLIIKTQSEINLIKEYQQSLISEVVTGKVDVTI